MTQIQKVKIKESFPFFVVFILTVCSFSDFCNQIFHLWDNILIKDNRECFLFKISGSNSLQLKFIITLLVSNLFYKHNQVCLEWNLVTHQCFLILRITWDLFLIIEH